MLLKRRFFHDSSGQENRFRVSKKFLEGKSLCILLNIFANEAP